MSSVPVGASEAAAECDGGAALPGSATTTRSGCCSAARRSWSGRSWCCADMGFTRHVRAPPVGDRPDASRLRTAGSRYRQSTPLREYSAIIL